MVMERHGKLLRFATINTDATTSYFLPSHSAAAATTAESHATRAELDSMQAECIQHNTSKQASFLDY